MSYRHDVAHNEAGFLPLYIELTTSRGRRGCTHGKFPIESRLETYASWAIDMVRIVEAYNARGANGFFF